MVIQELKESTRRKAALAEIVKYWSKNDREASFQKLADILENKMKMTLSYAVESFITPLTPMENDLIETFLEKLGKPLPDLGILASELCVQDVYCRLPKNEKNVTNVIKFWIIHSHKFKDRKQHATWGSLKGHMQKAIKKTIDMQRGQRDTAEASLTGITIL